MFAALETTTSSRPASRSITSIMAVTWPRFPTSQTIGVNLASPRRFSSAAPFSTDSAVVPQKNTIAPSRRNLSTISKPVFRLPPVTRTTLPSNCFIAFTSHCSICRRS